MNEEQKKTVETWTKTRDTLLGEISNLTIEKEQKTKELEGIAESANLMAEEIATWKDKIAKLAEEYGSLTSIKQKDIEYLDKELSKKNEEKFNLEKDLVKLDELKSKTLQETNDLQSIISSAKKTMIEISSIFPNFIGQIREEIVSVKQAVSDVNVFVNYFKDTINAIEIAQANKDIEQTKRDNYLNEREAILNNESKIKTK